MLKLLVVELKFSLIQGNCAQFGNTGCSEFFLSHYMYLLQLNNLQIKQCICSKTTVNKGFLQKIKLIIHFGFDKFFHFQEYFRIKLYKVIREKLLCKRVSVECIIVFNYSFQFTNKMMFFTEVALKKNCENFCLYK